MLMKLNDQNAIFFKISRQKIKPSFLKIRWKHWLRIQEIKMKLYEFISIKLIFADIDVDSKKNVKNSCKLLEKNPELSENRKT